MSHMILIYLSQLSVMNSKICTNCSNWLFKLRNKYCFMTHTEDIWDNRWTSRTTQLLNLLLLPSLFFFFYFFFRVEGIKKGSNHSNRTSSRLFEVMWGRRRVEKRDREMEKKERERNRWGAYSVRVSMDSHLLYARLLCFAFHFAHSLLFFLAFLYCISNIRLNECPRGDGISTTAFSE